MNTLELLEYILRQLFQARLELSSNLRASADITIRDLMKVLYNEIQEV